MSVGYHSVTIQRFDNGNPSTVLIAPKVVGDDDVILLSRAMRDLNVKNTKTVSWRLVSKELIKRL